MSRYIVRRLIQFVPTLFGVYTFTFFLMRILPGDPAKFLIGFHGSADALARLRAAMNLDDPILVQYLSLLARTVRGDLGNSYITGQPVTEMLAQAIPLTFLLAVAATLIAMVVGVPLGILSAVRKDGIVDNFSRLVAILGAAMPTFWLGIQFQILFGLQFKLLPVSGTGLDNHLILPALTLALPTLALMTRMTRSCLLDELNQDYMRTALSKGLRYRQAVWRHALRNALLPVTTIWGLSLADLLTGALLVEVIFSWPGLGRLLVQAISTRDYPLLQGNIIVLAVVYAGSNLLVDILYTLIDPRIRYE